jgi:hypothetical protein
VKSILALVAIVSPLFAGAQSGSTRVPVDDVRVLLISAIDSPTGQAQGVLTGRWPVSSPTASRQLGRSSST